MAIIINGTGSISGVTTLPSTVSSLNLTTLGDGTNSTSTTNTVRGSAKAWVAFNDSSTILSSYNVSSITNLGASGNFSRFQVNFTNAMSDTNYCAITTGSTTTTPYAMHINQSYATPSTSNVVLLCTVYNSSGAYTPALMNVAIFR